MIFDLPIPIPDDSQYWQSVKTIAQIVSYCGTAASTVLSIGAILYKSTREPSDVERRLDLTRFGRYYLAAFLVTSLVAIGSTVMKDHADNKLSEIAEQKQRDAEEIARKQLLKGLGKKFDDFVAENMDPAFRKINRGISSSTKGLNQGIRRSVDTLSSAMAQSGSDEKREMMETAAEAATANLQIGSYELEVRLPYRYEAERQRHLQKSEHLFDPAYLQVAKLCAEPQPAERADEATCGQMYTAYRDWQAIAGFKRAIITDSKDGFELKIAFPKLLVYIDDKPDCLLLWGPKNGDSRSQIPCIQTRDNAIDVFDPAIVQIEQPTPVGFFDDVGPALRYRESGSEMSEPAQAPEFINIFGRDVEVRQIQLRIYVRRNHFHLNLPERLEVVETLHPLKGQSPIERTYELRLKASRPEDSPHALTVAIAAQYTRY